MSYKPLPNYLAIRKSKIQGSGLFATKDIPEGTVLGISHILTRDHGLLRTPIGAFYNHSDTPNTERRYHMKDISKFELVTLIDIFKGEEITVKYSLYDPTEKSKK